jgi:hypothetical protein
MNKLENKLEVGNFVTCIEIPSRLEKLTLDKVYRVEKIIKRPYNKNKEFIYILPDKGKLRLFDRKFFCSRKYWREQQLNKILE